MADKTPELDDIRRSCDQALRLLQDSENVSRSSRDESQQQMAEQYETEQQRKERQKRERIKFSNLSPQQRAARAARIKREEELNRMSSEYRSSTQSKQLLKPAFNNGILYPGIAGLLLASVYGSNGGAAALAIGMCVCPIRYLIKSEQHKLWKKISVAALVMFFAMFTSVIGGIIAIEIFHKTASTKSAIETCHDCHKIF